MSESIFSGLGSRGSANGIVRQALVKNHPSKPPEEVDDLERMVVLQPEQSGQEIVAMVDRIEGERSREGKEPRGDKSDIDRAESIEIINSSTSSQEEYFDWIATGAKVIKDMNDGFVSHDDLKEKNDLLGILDHREVELLVCLSLYRSSGFMEGNSPEQERAKARYKQLEQKLLKLREIRTVIAMTTKNEEDVPVTPREYEDSAPVVETMEYVAVCIEHRKFNEADLARDVLRAAIDGKGNLSKEERIKLQLPPYDKEKDKLLGEELEAFMLKMKAERLRGKREFLAEHFVDRGGEEKAEDIRHRILEMRGIAKPATLLDKDYVKNVRQRQFDVDKFKMLEQKLSYSRE